MRSEKLQNRERDKPQKEIEKQREMDREREIKIYIERDKVINTETDRQYERQRERISGCRFISYLSLSLLHWIDLQVLVLFICCLLTSRFLDNN